MTEITNKSKVTAPQPRPVVPILVGLLVIGAGVFFLNSQLNSSTDPGPKKKPPIPVTSASAQQRSVPVEISSVGNVEATSTVAIRSQVDGQLLKVNFQQGQLVRQGQMLFELDPQQAQAVLAQAQAQVNKDLAAVEQARAILRRDQAQSKNAQSQLKRYQKLLTLGAISQDAFDQYQANADALAATLRADEANIRNAQALVNADRAAVTQAQVKLRFSSIRAPLDGRTGDLNFYAGDLIKANDTNPLVIINRISPVYVTFTIPEAKLSLLRRAMTSQTLNVTAQVPNDTHRAEGSLSFMNNAVDTTTGMIKLKATFNNRDNYLVPGQFVNTTLTLKTLPKAVVVPTQAVQTGQQGRYVFVILPDQSVAQRPVTNSFNYQNWAVIDQGLRPGEQVVTDGQLQLVPGAKVQLIKK